MTPAQREIADNIRRDIAAAGVPWEKFRRASLALLALNCLCKDKPFHEVLREVRSRG